MESNMPSEKKNVQVLLARRPENAPQPDDFEVRDGVVPRPTEGQILVRNAFLSLDPYMRGRMKDAKDAYADPYPLGAPVGGTTVGTVIESRSPGYRCGDLVVGPGGWQHFSAYDGVEARKLPDGMDHPSHALGVLGMTGQTAWHGLLSIGEPKAGETLVVGAASGAVGSIVGQIAKLKGCRVVGIAGGPDKCRHVVENLGFDACIDHRDEAFATNLKDAVPEGIDIYFENVGGAVFDAVWPLLNIHARMPVCGTIARYNGADTGAQHDRVPELAFSLIARRITMKGFLIFDHKDEIDLFTTEMNAWLADGSIRADEDITDGLAHAPEVFIGMLGGGNLGKTIIRL
jgi:NADPH-dependent curcumin reductase CurA